MHRYLRQLAPVAAFGTAVADIMLHGRPGDLDPSDRAGGHLARLRLIEMLTPRCLPGSLQLPATRTQRYSSFTLAMPAQLDLCLRRRASSLLSKASIDEPVAAARNPAPRLPAGRRPRSPPPARPASGTPSRAARPPA